MTTHADRSAGYNPMEELMRLDLSRRVDAKPRMVIRPLLCGCWCGSRYAWHLVMLGYGAYFGGCVRHHEPSEAYDNGMFQHYTATGGVS